MIKPLDKNKIKLFLLAAFLFLFSSLINLNLIIPPTLALLYIFFLRGEKFSKIKNCSLINLNFLFLCGFTAGYFILKNGLNFYFIPIIIVPMMATLLFNNLEVPFFISLVTSISLAALTSQPFLAFIVFITSCVASILFINGARKRATVIRAGVFVAIIQVIILLLTDKFQLIQPYRYLVVGISSLASGIIVLGILPVFEYFLETATNISLLELTDTHQPLLQKLIIEAPGTYHHSLIVGNLADSACNAVKANALLARIGAYYHDIGKLTKPEYFIENQEVQKNIHEDLTPTMSKIVIMNHVKEGLELAKKYRLPPSLWDFIAQHHGSSLVYYFYRRALEGKEIDEQVTEEGFRYPGPKPNSKESAIVLLADSVEAATRSLKDPSLVKIEELVHKIINNKFIDGQLDECELTLKEIERISKVFSKILSGIYHSRIDYPLDNNHKKSAKEDSRS